MRYFLGPPVATEQIRETEHYIEVTTPVHGGGSLVSYIQKINADTFAACACWGGTTSFEVVFDLFENPAKAPKIAAGLRDSYPGLFLAYNNAVNEQYGVGAITQAIDPDDMNRKWFVVALFRASDPETFLTKMRAAIDRETTLSARIWSDFQASTLEPVQEVAVPARKDAFTAGDARALVGAWTRGLDWLDILLNQ